MTMADITTSTVLVTSNYTPTNWIEQLGITHTFYPPMNPSFYSFYGNTAINYYWK